MAAVRFHPAAEEELVDATDWYLARSGTAALGFVRARTMDNAERTFPFGKAQ